METPQAITIMTQAPTIRHRRNIIKAPVLSHNSGDDVHKSVTNKRDRDRKRSTSRWEYNAVERKRQQQREERCLRRLITATMTLSVVIVGVSIYFARLILVVDPSLQSHLPSYIKQFLDRNNHIISSLHVLVPSPTIVNSPSNDAAEFRVETSDVVNAQNVHTNVGEGRGWDEDKGEKEEDGSSTTKTTPNEAQAYIVPNSMPHIGDKSNNYARFRRYWDERYPQNHERSLRTVQNILAQNHKFDSMGDHLGYDVYDCPDEPPPGYPREYKTIDILRHWPPTQSLPMGSQYSLDNSDKADAMSFKAHLGICVFDYKSDYEKAITYQSKELPYVVRNDPMVAETVERWNDEDYRRALFGGLDHSGNNGYGVEDDMGEDGNSDVNTRRVVQHRAERSVTNQVLFRHASKKKPFKTSKYAPTPDTREDMKRAKSQGYHGPRHDSGREGPPIPPPTKLISMTYDKWYARAMKKEKSLRNETNTGVQYYDPNSEGKKDSYYYYFRLVGCGEKEGCEKNSTEYLFDELPFFQPRRKWKANRKQRERGIESSETRAEPPLASSIPQERKNLYLVEPEKQRGIHCRFGMPGMIAINHYDASRNAIAILGGTRRYILSRPEQCPNMGLYPIGHISARHTKVDWTTASDDYEKLQKEEEGGGGESDESDEMTTQSRSKPTFPSSDSESWKEYNKALSLLVNRATSTEVVLQAGDVLYLPSYWFHFIISLDTNMQCNTRSGRDAKDEQTMTDCGFPPPDKRR